MSYICTIAVLYFAINVPSLTVKTILSQQQQVYKF